MRKRGGSEVEVVFDVVIGDVLGRLNQEGSIIGHFAGRGFFCEEGAEDASVVVVADVAGE